MKLNFAKILLPASLGLLANACATAVPAPLVLARVSYTVSTSGAAAAVAPSYLADAQASLEKANQEFAAHGDTGICRDYAYITENKIELAETVARVQIQRRQLESAAVRSAETADASGTAPRATIAAAR